MKREQVSAPDALKHSAHFVSPEAPPHQPVPVDEKHASIEQGHPDPLTDTMDGQGVIANGNSQQVDVTPEEIGGRGERTVKATSRVTEGRHVTSQPGAVASVKRKAHVHEKRKETAKLFEKSEAGAKLRQ